MVVVGLTGGIAMGKSVVLTGIRSIIEDARIFDADQCVSELLTHEEICEKVSTEFGDSSLTNDGQIDRHYLRERAFDSADQRAKLEGILHPGVHKEYLMALDSAERDDVPFLIADIPLLYESSHNYNQDLTLVVASDHKAQMKRLLMRPGISEEMARKMIEAQLPIKKKIELADHLIWNSGSIKQLEKQIYYFALWLKKKN
ncbi:MAG: dephospho-CoA kinase [Verrucomicrobiales bacterium]|nr:dephospho-CoA kinase [Verrucomicrobiales bacterium]